MFYCKSSEKRVVIGYLQNCHTGGGNDVVLFNFAFSCIVFDKITLYVMAKKDIVGCTVPFFNLS